VLFQRKIRRLEWMPAPEAEAIARDETLKSLHTIARQQVDLVVHEHPPKTAAPSPALPPDDVDDEGQLSPGEVMQLMSDRREGKVSPDDVRRLLSTFVKCGPSREEVVEYVRERCAGYLSGDCSSLDHAIGVARGRGKPRTGEDRQMRQDRQMRMAVEVLRARLSGQNFQEAIEATAEAFEKIRRAKGETFGCGVTTVSEAWAAYWPDAINTLFAERMLFGCDDPSGRLLTSDETERLEGIEKALVGTPAYSRHFAGVTKRSKRHK
jgi:hypothetical protein